MSHSIDVGSSANADQQLIADDLFFFTASFPGPDRDSLSDQQRARLVTLMAAYAGCLDRRSLVCAASLYLLGPASACLAHWNSFRRGVSINKTRNRRKKRRSVAS